MFFRLWSKKYPICIILNKEKMNLELNVDKKDDLDNESEHRTRMYCTLYEILNN